MHMPRLLIRPLVVLSLIGTLAAGEALPDGRWLISLGQDRPGADPVKANPVKANPVKANPVKAEGGEGGEGGEEGEGASEAKTAASAIGAQGLSLVLERAEGRWIPLVGDAEQCRCFGLIEEAKDGRLKVTVLIDAMSRKNNLFKTQNRTSLTTYTLELTGLDKTVKGTWKSTHGGGAVSGRILPRPAVGTPAATGEHPRFLLRSADLAALKAKAATSWGQAMVKALDQPEAWSRSSRAVGLGLLYRITGEKRYAREAQALIQTDIASGWWDVIGPIHDPPHKILEAVYAWDLIHDACDEDFRRELPRLARRNLRFMDDFCDILRGNGHPHSNWSAQFMSGLGLAALACLADPADPDPAPETGIPSITPPTTPPEGLPVLPFDGPKNQTTRWLVAGPFDMGLGHDGLASLGGEAKAVIRDGLKFPLKVKANESREVNDKDGLHYIQMKNTRPPIHWYTYRGDDLQPLTKEIEGVFRPFPAQWICGETTYAGAPGWMDLRIASGFRSYRTFYLAAALEVPSATTVIVRFQNQQRDRPRVWISGRMVRVNDMVTLAPGIHPVIYPLTYTTFIASHGRDQAIYDSFQLVPATSEQVDQLRRHRQCIRDFHDLASKTLAGTSYADFWPHLWLAYARAKMDQWCRNAISEGGWNIAGDCYSIPSLQALGPFAHAYATSTGAGLASPGNLGQVLPHQVHKTVFAADRAFAPPFGRGGGPYGPMIYARCFSFVDTGLKPAVGWAAHRTLELAQAGKLASENLVVADLDPLSAAFALVQWPLPEAVKPPQGILPLAVAAWTFRNRFQDGEDAVAMIAGWIHPGGDWGDVVSGEWRLSALGHDWAMRGGSVSRDEAFHNIVFPAMQYDGKSTVWRQVLYREAGGSAAGAPGTVRLQMHTMGKNGDAGPVIGSRSFLSDFSGACGAPVLVVLRDRVPPVPPPPPKKDDVQDLDKSDKELGDNADLLGSVGKPVKPPTFAERNQHLHRWMMVTDPAHQVTVRPDGFTLTAKDGTTLVATVLSPAKPRIHHEPAGISMELNYRYDHRGGPTPRTAIQVAGDGPFLVAMTVQKGQAPKVALAGDRLSIGDVHLRIGEDGIRP
jgi:hypothetical protein